MITGFIKYHVNCSFVLTIRQTLQPPVRVLLALITHFLSRIEPPELESHGGRQYKIEIKNIRKIVFLFQQFRQ